MIAVNRPGWFARLSIHVLIYAGAVTMVAPFAWMVTTSLKTQSEALGKRPSAAQAEAEAPTQREVTLLPAGAPADWQWENYAEAWRAANLDRFYFNSIFVSVVVTAVSLLHIALAGFAFAKLRFAGRRITFLVLLLTMMLPYQVYFIFAYILCVQLGYVDNYQALIVPFLASAFGVFYMRQAIVSVPDDLIDAGRVDGMSYFETFLHVVLPTVRASLGALAIFTFMVHWNSFFWPLIVIDSERYMTLPLAIAALSSGSYSTQITVQMAAATIITLPTIGVYLLFERQFVRGIALTGLKG